LRVIVIAGYPAIFAGLAGLEDDPAAAVFNDEVEPGPPAGNS